MQDYHALHQWSISQTSDFWRFLFTFFPIVYSGDIPGHVVDEAAPMQSVPKWFPGVKLNFAENVLFVRDAGHHAANFPGKEDEKVAVIAAREGAFRERIFTYSWGQLREQVGRLSQAMIAHGVRKGDRIAVVASNCPETLLVFLACTALGAIFSSSSTEIGVQGILGRLLQIKPKFVFMEDASVYNGVTHDLRPNIAAVSHALRALPEFRGLVSQARFPDSPADVSDINNCQPWTTFMSRAKSSNLTFERLDFSDPMIIVYSSGTTGQPKCLVHSVGGVILNGWKESALHRQVDSTSVQMQFTTTSWMMYMSSVQLLLTGARLVLYDGSPFAPDKLAFLRFAAHAEVTHLGISPKYLQTLQANRIVPRDVADLSRLEVVTSTGAVLPDSLFVWFYDEAFPPNVQLANISGGTEIAGGIGTSNPLLPVFVGGCQCISLGMDVNIFESVSEVNGPAAKGHLVTAGEAGELVLSKPFPSMPICIWGDENGDRYQTSYFSTFADVWAHGDFISIHPQTKRVIFWGRSDGVLNPGGIRFGSADIYSVVESNFPDQVVDSLCVGQRRPGDPDETVILFLQMKPGVRLTKNLAQAIKTAVSKAHSPRHVPAYLIEAPAIPVSSRIVVAADVGIMEAHSLTEYSFRSHPTGRKRKQLSSGLYPDIQSRGRLAF